MSEQFPLYPYASDPLRILATRNEGPAVETAATAPQEDDAPRDGEVADAIAADGGVEAAPQAQQPEEAHRPLHHPSPSASDGPPPRSGEDQEDDHEDDGMQRWLFDNWDTVLALAKVRQAPAAPEPPPPPPEPVELPPVQVRKGDRWNKWKMAEFLRQLAATHSVSAAAKSVGLNRRSAYRLRSRLKGQPFDIAWEAAFRHGYDNLAHAALDRAINGVEVPHYHQGELVGTSRRYDERLTVALLAMTNSVGAPMLGRYRAASEYWSESWEQMVHRIETGSVTWDDERRMLSAAELKELEPDPERRCELLAARNAPDERPRGRLGRQR